MISMMLWFRHNTRKEREKRDEKDPASGAAAEPLLYGERKIKQTKLSNSRSEEEEELLGTEPVEEWSHLK